MLEVDVSGCFFSCPPGKQGIRQISNWEPAPARKLIQLLGIDELEVGLITINGVKISLEDIIPGEAKVSILPFFYGG